MQHAATDDAIAFRPGVTGYASGKISACCLVVIACAGTATVTFFTLQANFVKSKLKACSLNASISDAYYWHLLVSKKKNCS